MDQAVSETGQAQHRFKTVVMHLVDWLVFWLAGSIYVCVRVGIVHNKVCKSYRSDGEPLSTSLFEASSALRAHELSYRLHGCVSARLAQVGTTETVCSARQRL